MKIRRCASCNHVRWSTPKTQVVNSSKTYWLNCADRRLKKRAKHVRPCPIEEKGRIGYAESSRRAPPGTPVPQGALRLGKDQPGFRYRGFKANGAHNT